MKNYLPFILDDTKSAYLYFSCKIQKPKCMLVDIQVFSLLVMLMYSMYVEVLSKGCCYAVPQWSLKVTKMIYLYFSFLWSDCRGHTGVF